MSRDRRSWPTGPGFWASMIQAVRSVVQRKARAGDVDDLVQDILVELLRGTSEVKEPIKFAAVVARNLCARYFAQRARRTIEVADLDSLPSEPQSVLEVRGWLRDFSATRGGTKAGKLTPFMIQVLRGVVNGATSMRQLASQLCTQPHRVRESLRCAAERIRALDVPVHTT